ncbi:MAG: M23 family metallopeptidase [Dermatophilus congolensis]|nr:M23 family metallopeptidase [Dermatophilus congolensis]
MPEPYKGRHRSVQTRVGKRAASLFTSGVLAIGVIASDATDLGAVPPSSPAGSPGSAAAAAPAAKVPAITASADDSPGTAPASTRHVVSTAALGGAVGGAGLVSVATTTATRLSAAQKTGQPATAAAAKKGAAPARAKAAPKPKPAPERSTMRRSPSSVTAGTPGAVAVPMGLAAARSLDWSEPVVNTRISSGYGQRWGRLHAGLDYAGPIGTPVRSVGLGVVTFAGPQGAYGNKIEVTLWDGTEVHYGHLSRIHVKVGDQVTSGQRIGAIGNTGRSTGPHLHLEVRPGGGSAIDPRPWLQERDAF